MDEMDFDFRDQIQATDWYPLEIHYKNEALFILGGELNLALVAKAVAADELEKVKAWLDLGQLRRPELDEIELWRQDPYKLIGHFIIVAPYVFMQLQKDC